MALDPVTTQPLPPVTLVLGGARSGKSAYAERLIEVHGPGLYVATAEAGDAEMAERIRRHQERRGGSWTTVEEPLDLAGALKATTAPGLAVLVDCLTLWLNNLMAAKRDVDAEVAGLLDVLGTLAAPVVLVTNEVGLGVVPDNVLARTFVDAAGLLNQAVAKAADRVVFVVAGTPLVFKDNQQ